MSENWFKPLARNLFRWYLSKFPLRDGKAYLYQRLHARLAPGDRYVTSRLDLGFTMRLDLQDPEQLKVYFYGHYHERYEARLVQRLLDPGEVFWDIGANIGYFSLAAAAALNHRGQVIALEPGRNASARLRENVALNPFTNIKIYQLAASDTAGEARLYLAPDLADSSASLFAPGPDQAGYETCRTVPLDQLLRDEGLPGPQLLKMDVEGAELAALKGAAGLLADSSPLLLIEMEEKNLEAAGASKAAIQQWLSGFGYRAAFLRHGRWHLTDDVDTVKGRNIFWFKPDLPSHRDRAARLPVHGVPRD